MNNEIIENDDVVKGKYESTLNIIANLQMFAFVIVSMYILLSMGITNIEDALSNTDTLQFNTYFLIISGIIFIQGITIYMLIQTIKVIHQDVSELKYAINDDEI